MSSAQSGSSAASELAVTRNKNDLAAVMDPKQESALQLLQAGRSVVETAQTVGVARSTIYFWLKHDPVFLAAYNQWHNELAETTRSKLAVLSDKAVGAMDKALEAGDAKLALQLLKGLGFIRPRDEAEQITDPQELRKRQEHTRRQKSLELRREKGRMDMDAMTADLGF